MIPRHVAIVMDGNGRWATRRGLPRGAGHARGAEAVRRTVRAARELGIEALTLFAFSAQNWARPSAEVAQLMALLGRFLRAESAELLAGGVRLVGIGDRARLPAEIRAALAEAEAQTAAASAMTLCLALSYGGREDLAAAARALARRVRDEGLDPERIDVEAMEGALSTRGLPPVDLAIRTSGERRLSNFLLWELAYAELHFTACAWPDFGAAQLREALAAYAGRERRFGGLPAAVAR